MAVTDSRVKTGKLELSVDGTTFTPFSCQPTNVTVTPTYTDAGDPVEVLCGDSLAAAATVAWALNITAVQDFDNPAGLMAFLRTNLLKNISFKFTPNATGEVCAGTCQARPGPWYGDVAVRLTTAIVMPINGTPTWAAQTLADPDAADAAAWRDLPMSKRPAPVTP